MKNPVNDFAFQIAQLRHLYQQMVDDNVVDEAEAARGLLGPAIASFERCHERLEAFVEAFADARAAAVEQSLEIDRLRRKAATGE